MTTNKIILHVDDDRLLAKSVEENVELYLENCKVVIAGSYTDALDKVKSEDYDLILLDVMMSITEEDKQENKKLKLGDDLSTGIVLREAIEDHYKNEKSKMPKLAYFTAKSLDESEKEGIEVISKPTVPERYLRIIRSLLESTTAQVAT